MITAPHLPGALPPVWNVPHRRHPGLVGRRELLDAMVAGPGLGLTAGLQAITGQGGVGKTQLAVEYAYSHRDELDVVWWVRAWDATTLRGDVAALGRALGLQAARQANLHAAVRSVRAWLEDHDRWLVVVDDAEDAAAVGDVLPNGGGRTLVTSRSQERADGARVLDVDVLGEDEAAELLRWRTGEAERAPALSLARELGCLPLALEQAAAYVSQSPGVNLRSYLQMFRARASELAGGGRDRPFAVASTCALALERVEQISPVAVTLLRACAFLAPDGIPLSLFGNGVDELPEPLTADPVARAAGLAVLARFSLLAGTSSAGITVHRLVQAVVRDHLGDNGRRTWATGALRLVAGAFPADSDDVASWGRCGRLVPHALAVTAHDEAAELEPQATSRLLDRVAAYQQGRAQFGEARRLLERAVVVAEVAYGPDDPEAGAHLRNLATVLHDLGEHVDARVCLERALAIAEAAYGADDPTVGGLLDDLGSVLRDLGELALAQLCFQRALAIDEAAYGPDHPAVARDVSNLALGRQDLGDFAEARRGFERALAIAESAFGPDHPEVGTHLNNLALVLQDLGELVAARVCLDRALAIGEAVLGPEHPATAGVLNNLGSVLSGLGELAAARVCFERALAIDEAALGLEHPTVRALRHNRAQLMKKLGADE